MEMTKHSTKFTAEDLDKIKKFVPAFENNFHEIILHRYQHGAVEVYLNEKDLENGSYIQYCDNADYLAGWLNGAIQAKNQMIV